MNEYLIMEDAYFTIKIQRPGKEKIKGLNLNPQLKLSLPHRDRKLWGFLGCLDRKLRGMFMIWNTENY